MSEEKKITRNLEVNLTAVELKAFGATLAIESINLSDLEAEKSRITKAYKESIDEKYEEVMRLAGIVRNEKEVREVECEWRFAWGENTKTLVRLDTHEIVETRPIEASERQAMLAGMEAEEHV